jgi:hypothetical protein
VAGDIPDTCGNCHRMGAGSLAGRETLAIPGAAR